MYFLSLVYRAIANKAMENLYHHTQRLILDLQNLLPRAERSYGKDAQDVEGNMLAFLEEVTRYCFRTWLLKHGNYYTIFVFIVSSNIQQLDVLVNKELPVRRREARLRVDQLKQERLLLQVVSTVSFILAPSHSESSVF